VASVRGRWWGLVEGTVAPTSPACYARSSRRWWPARDASSSRQRCRLLLLSAVTPCSSSRRRSPPLGGAKQGAGAGRRRGRVCLGMGKKEKESRVRLSPRYSRTILLSVHHLFGSPGTIIPPANQIGGAPAIRWVRLYLGLVPQPLAGHLLFFFYFLFLHFFICFHFLLCFFSFPPNPIQK
jgi:hypothetical protein